MGRSLPRSLIGVLVALGISAEWPKPLPASAGGANASLAVTLPTVASLSEYLPSVDHVILSLDAGGKCTSKSVTPSAVVVEARFVPDPAFPLSPPAAVSFSLESSALPGTATNEDCELGLEPTKDFSIAVPDVATQQIEVTETAPGSGRYRTVLYSHDWGGRVKIDVSGVATGRHGTTSLLHAYLVLPVDVDGDGLPNLYEDNRVAGVDNRTTEGAHVLDRLDPDRDGNGHRDGDDRFARDGLTNLEKYRGVYFGAPPEGMRGAMQRHQRLGAGMRHLFVRGRGFGNDPLIVAHPGTCGVDTSSRDPSRWTPAPDSKVSATNPCPPFALIDAFRSAGVVVHDVSSLFTATGVFPTRSFAPNTTGPTATLDMATVVYDGITCGIPEGCDDLSALGPEDEIVIGLSAYGSPSRYGGFTRVLKRSVDAYFHVNWALPMHRDRTLPPAMGELAAAVLAQGGAAMVEWPDPRLQESIPTTTNTTNDSIGVSLKNAMVRWAITHELGHAVGVVHHSRDVDDVMFPRVTPSALHGSSLAKNVPIHVHNKGLQ